MLVHYALGKSTPGTLMLVHYLEVISSINTRGFSVSSSSPGMERDGA